MAEQKSKLRRVMAGPYRDKFIAVWSRGPLGSDPALCRAFLGKIEKLCRTGKTDAEIYAGLRAFYEGDRARFDACLITGREARAQARADKVRALVPAGFRPESFLDIGCGDGLVTSRLAGIFNLEAGKMWGIDLAPPAESGTFKFIGYDAEGRIPAPDQNFDFMTVLMVLHHVREPEKMLSDLARVLAAGGYLLVRDHDTKSREDFDFFAVMDEIFYTVFDPAPGLARDFNYRSKEEWRESFARAGLEIIALDESESHSAFAPVWFLLQKSHGPLV